MKYTVNAVEEAKEFERQLINDFLALEAVYAIVYFDAKDILGLWISKNEGAKFWLNNFTKMKNRGLKNILIACGVE